MNKRDLTFDILRVIGLLAIILAHVSPPALLFQLRNFDVPLMVLISGAVYSISSSPTKKYSSYIWSRVLRLLLPTWVFLTFYFLFLFAIGKPSSVDTIFSTFSLQDGIGYVWIIRVFILVALISPLLIWVNRKINNGKQYLLLIAVIYILYEIVFLSIKSSNLIVNDFLFYVIPYGCVAALGIFSAKTDRRVLLLFSSVFMFIYVILSFKLSANGYLPTQAAKYPPRIYYLSFALMITYMLYYISSSKVFKYIFSLKIMQFIAFSSLWIYLWHIFYITVWIEIKSNLPMYTQNYLIEFMLVLSFSVMTVYFQKLIVGNVIKFTVTYPRFTKFISLVFMK